MQENTNNISLEDSSIQVYFHPQCENGEVDDELTERIEAIVNTIIKGNKQYLFSYINDSNAQGHFKLYENIKVIETKQIVVLYKSFIIGDATEVENILINDYKDDTNNRNIRNQPKRIINGGNDEYYVYIVIAD